MAVQEKSWNLNSLLRSLDQLPDSFQSHHAQSSHKTMGQLESLCLF